jgi:hypothetical protein
MPISRRGFLGRAAGASAAGVATAAGLRGLFAQNPVFSSECVVIDPGARCPLRESAAGYESALSSLNIEFRRAALHSLPPARTIILPSAVSTKASTLDRVREHLEKGSTVLYESGAAFLSAGDFGFHKRVIRSVFGLSLHRPVGLWDSADSLKQSPYVDYHWPVEVKVRDFSRVVPVGPDKAKTTASFQNLPVAARRRVGKGTLVFLGSPLGPHLLSGDAEATRWLQAFCSLS